MARFMSCIAKKLKARDSIAASGACMAFGRKKACNGFVRHAAMD
ncbi:hypothetical protein [Variovorax boronicumulans]